jgi:hypothetical protein
VVACSASPPDVDLGIAVEPQVPVYAIAGVRASPGTVHLTGLAALLNSAEATGPIVLTTHVGTFVQPMMSTTVTGVDPEKVSHAVGYSLWERHDLLAVSSATLRDLERSRLEAYASFDETSWEVRDGASGALLGNGASFDPSGVYFQTVPASHVALPDMGVVTLAQGSPPPGYVPPGSEGDDAGAPERNVPGFVPSVSGPAPSEHEAPGVVPPPLGAGAGRH